MGNQVSETTTWTLQINGEPVLREKKQEILWIEGLMREWERKKEGDKHVYG